MHNYCPGRRVFLPSSCAQGLSGGRGGGGDSDNSEFSENSEFVLR